MTDRLTVAAAVVLIVVPAATVVAQARPAGGSRAWLELDVGGAQQAQRCPACVTSNAVGGVALSGSGGITFRHGFGIGVLAREFQSISFEYSQKSRYLLALAQYSPKAIPALTINAAIGSGTHHGDYAPRRTDGTGAVVGAGLALRAPASNWIAVCLTADWLKSVGGTYRPRLLSVGVGLALAAPPTLRL